MNDMSRPHLPPTDGSIASSLVVEAGVANLLVIVDLATRFL